MSEKVWKRELIVKWYDQYSLRLFKYIAKMVKDVHQAEDLTQETFIKAYNYAASELEVQHPKAFLYRIAHNLSLDYLKKQAPLLKIKDFFSNRTGPDPSTETAVEIQENVKELYEALQRLKPSYREVIILRKIEDFSIEETTQILGWSENKVKVTLFRAMQALEEELTKEGFIHETS